MHIGLVVHTAGLEPLRRLGAGRRLVSPVIDDRRRPVRNFCAGGLGNEEDHERDQSNVT